MVGGRVGLVDDRVVAVHDPSRRIAFVERGQPGVAHPQVRAGRPNVGEEALGVAAVEVAHRGREHHDVAGRLEVAEDELFGHPRTRRVTTLETAF
jgi:hypothetical protein